MEVVLSHPTGNANVRSAAVGLQQAGILSEFRTSIASFPGELLDILSKAGPFSEIQRRSFDSSLKSVTKTWPWFELIRLAATRAGFTNIVKHGSGPFCVDALYRGFDEYVSQSLKQASRNGATAIYAYEDGAKLSFKMAKALKLLCFYDLPIGYWRTARRLLQDERINNPEWAATLVGLDDSAEKLARKDEELQLADQIFVASRFTALSLEEYPGKLPPIEVIPYGFPNIAKDRKYSSTPLNRPLKLLFVGGLSQRKGLSYLFSAVDKIKKHIELTIVGQKPYNGCEALNEALTKHRWIPTLSHAEILKLMQQHDVLVFPSLFEGFGLVITEAMSQGTPVITTSRTAGPDIIEHDSSGWIVEAGSSDALQEAMVKLIDNPITIVEAGKAAIEKARLRPWQKYGQELAEAILKHY